MRRNVLKKITAGVMSLMLMSGCMTAVFMTNTVSVKADMVVNAEINVDKVEGLSDDFIMGADLSSYCSVVDSGVVFKDFEGNELDDAGFFGLLKESGINYVRVRVWNDPFDADGKTYGGGANDIKTAARLGKLATAAGMKVLVDFHYSDFWADPSKQQAPKAWEGLSVDDKATKLYDYTKESLNYLKGEGVDVGMVQIGNETTGSFCGTSDWTEICKLFNAGSKAVREIDKNIQIAVHFTNPEKANRYTTYASTLDKNEVDYDIFASSYYAVWHGTFKNLTNVLKKVADKYDKKVMVVETSYAFTLDDYDGHTNTIDVADELVKGYDASVQGQASMINDVIKAVADIGEAGIGVFYWEAAWNGVANAYNEDGTVNEAVYEANKGIWESKGSGWATSFAGSYDPKDAGQYYGGCAVENQSFFGYDGKALPSLKVFEYVKTGATTEATAPEETTEAPTTKKNVSDYITVADDDDGGFDFTPIIIIGIVIVAVVAVAAVSVVIIKKSKK